MHHKSPAKYTNPATTTHGLRAARNPRPIRDAIREATREMKLDPSVLMPFV